MAKSRRPGARWSEWEVDLALGFFNFRNWRFYRLGPIWSGRIYRLEAVKVATLQN